MNILGFTDEERMSMFKTVAGTLHFGNIEVKQRPREEWATIPTTTEAEKVKFTIIQLFSMSIFHNILFEIASFTKLNPYSSLFFYASLYRQLLHTYYC